MNKDTYRILIIDDHPIITDGVEQLLRKQPQACFTQVNDLDTLTRQLEESQFNLCITDLEFPGIQGFGILQIIHESLPQCPILIYTMHDEPWIAAKLCELSMRNSIFGAVSKHDNLHEISLAVTVIRNGESYFSQPFQLLGRKRPNIDLLSSRKLSEREKEVLTYIVKGYNTNEIAKHMCLSVNTIHTYRKRLFQKLDVKNVVELVSRYKGFF